MNPPPHPKKNKNKKNTGQKIGDNCYWSSRSRSVLFIYYRCTMYQVNRAYIIDYI